MRFPLLLAFVVLALAACDRSRATPTDAQDLAVPTPSEPAPSETPHSEESARRMEGGAAPTTEGQRGASEGARALVESEGPPVDARADLPPFDAFDRPAPPPDARWLPPAPVMGRVDVAALRAFLTDVDVFGVGDERALVASLAELGAGESPGALGVALDPQGGSASVDVGSGARAWPGSASRPMVEGEPVALGLPLPEGAVLRVAVAPGESAWLPSDVTPELTLFADGALVVDLPGLSVDALDAALARGQRFASVALGQANASAAPELQGFVRLASRWNAAIWARVHTQGTERGSRVGVPAPRCGGALRNLVAFALVAGALEVDMGEESTSAAPLAVSGALRVRAECAPAVGAGVLPLDALAAPALESTRRGALLMDLSALVRQLAPDALGLLPVALPDDVVADALGRVPLGVDALEDPAPTALVWWSDAQNDTTRAFVASVGTTDWLGGDGVLSGTTPVPLSDGRRLLSPDGLRTMRRMDARGASALSTLGDALPEGTLAAMVVERDALTSIGDAARVVGTLGRWDALSLSLDSAGMWRLAVTPTPDERAWQAGGALAGLRSVERAGVWGVEGDAAGLVRAALALVPDAANQIRRGAIDRTPFAPAPPR